MIWEAGRATSAAPIFFPRIFIGPDRAKQEFIDAGVGCNNPVKEVIKEADLVFGEERKVACIVSIGTGKASVIKYESPGKGEKTLPIKLAKVFSELATECDRAAEETEERYTSGAVVYCRLNVDCGLQDIRLEEWDKLGQVEGYTEDYLAQRGVGSKIDEVVAALIAASSNASTQVSDVMPASQENQTFAGIGHRLGN
jgi:hypothetical protein